MTDEIKFETPTEAPSPEAPELPQSIDLTQWRASAQQVLAMREGWSRDQFPAAQIGRLAYDGWPTQAARVDALISLAVRQSQECQRELAELNRATALFSFDVARAAHAAGWRSDDPQFTERANVMQTLVQAGVWDSDAQTPIVPEAQEPAAPAREPAPDVDTAQKADV